ncbi:MAG: hypothetical protein IJY52_04875 [Anaerotignum sp.]|nr:hypothetical protein [Anaerotignum sp.]
MGAVTVIIVGLCFSVYQIQKSNDPVFRLYEVGDGRNAGIQKGDGKGTFMRSKDFFCGIEPLFQKHGEHLLSLSKYVKTHFWALSGISLFQKKKGANGGWRKKII